MSFSTTDIQILIYQNPSYLNVKNLFENLTYAELRDIDNNINFSLFSLNQIYEIAEAFFERINNLSFTSLKEVEIEK